MPAVSWWWSVAESPHLLTSECLRRTVDRSVCSPNPPVQMSELAGGEAEWHCGIPVSPMAVAWVP